MNGVGKIYKSTRKQVLKDIWLSFLLWREDWRTRSERRWKELAPAHHCWVGHRLPG